MQVSVVIPNYNGKELLQKNLPKIIAAVGSAQVIIVDDASTDGSCEYIKKNYPKVLLIKKVTNSGFATTVNLGFKAAREEIVLLLNTDLIPRKDFLTYLLPYFEDPQVFAVGCLDESIEKKHTVKRGRGLGEFKQGFLVHRRGEIDKTNTLWVSAGSGAFRKSIWEKLGGMDSLYDPFYWEDIDLSYRALKAGYEIIFEPKSIVEHRHLEGSISNQYPKNVIKLIAYRNQFIFVWKNITDGLFIKQHLVWLPVHFLRSLIRTDSQFFKGFAAALLKFLEIMRHRKNFDATAIRTDKEILREFQN